MSTTRTKKMYRIQITAPLAVMLLVLSALSLAATFYLGMVAGKSMRRPIEDIEEASSDSAPKPDNVISEENLKFFGLGEKKPEPEPLNLNGLKSLKKKTEELTNTPTPAVAESPRTPAQPVSRKPAVSIPEKQPTAPPPKSSLAKQLEEPIVIKKPVITRSEAVKSKPKVVVSNKKNQPEYTVQVFASRKHDNAQKLVKKLKSNGFAGAYIYKHAPSSGGSSLYRVRVGRINRTESQRLAEKLRKLKFIDDVQVTRF